MTGRITVVSGLPRSGTSMMMRFVKLLGLPLLTSTHRPANANNPFGYFEFEPVKSIARDVSWLPEARGKAVKIVAPLVDMILPDERYNVIFMRREIEQVVASQIQFTGDKAGHIDEHDLARALRHLEMRTLTRLRARTEVALHEVRFEQVLTNPELLARDVAGFLGIAPDRATALAPQAFCPERIHHR